MTRQVKRKPVMLISPDETLLDRGKTHGDFEKNAVISEAIKSIIHQSPTRPKHTSTMRLSLDMISGKLGRICAGDPFTEDHWRDIAGYAMLVANELYRKSQK